MLVNKVLFTSNNMDWCTPQPFFDLLNDEFHFVLDAAASDANAKCPVYYTPETDGLKQSWNLRGGGLLQPALRTRYRQVGQESLGGIAAHALSHCRAHPRKNGYEVFSRLHPGQDADPLCQGAAQVYPWKRGGNRTRAFPFHGRCV